MLHVRRLNERDVLTSPVRVASGSVSVRVALCPCRDVSMRMKEMPVAFDLSHIFA